MPPTFSPTNTNTFSQQINDSPPTSWKPTIHRNDRQQHNTPVTRPPHKLGKLKEGYDTPDSALEAGVQCTRTTATLLGAEDEWDGFGIDEVSIQAAFT